jgi:hypothetical protein
LVARERREQLPADQVTAQDKEKIDPNPAPAINPGRRWKAHDPSVINDDYDDRERTKKIEARLAFAILKTRIYRK